MNINHTNSRDRLSRGKRPTFWLSALLLLMMMWLGLVPAPLQATEPAAPIALIESIRAVGEGLEVTIQVPPGKRRITLESRSRLTRGAWTPRIVRWSEAAEPTQLTFTLPADHGTEMIRVRDEREADIGLPGAFFQGTSRFAPVTESGGAANRGVPGAPGDGLFFSPTVADLASLDGVEQDSSRAVVESDIWKIDGRTLYFFNQLRGLQVFDLSNPDHPVLTGALPLAISGEQMYRLPAATSDGSVWLALLAQQGCNGQSSEVLLVNVKSGQPALASRLPVRGQIKETRLVGDALYLATFEWFQPNALETLDEAGNILGQDFQPWENRTLIRSFDLADPARPQPQPSVELPVSPDAIAATDRFLYVATTGTRTPQDNERLQPWAVAGNHAVILFDLSDPRGAITQLGHVLTAGRVADKFKLGQLGADADALAVVSEVQGAGRFIPENRPDGTTGTRWEWTPPKAVIETFSLANPAAPTALSQLTLVTNESVFATRFSGDRAYVVTFQRVDPLWIVDLSDPARPEIQGELEIPGFSTYLQPLANDTRLLALGIEGGRTIVQLFDVADATRPTLMSKVFLGEGWSWSEGNSDEKAFQVFPDAGLALVPWQGQRSSDPGDSSQSFQGVQLIDFDLAAGTLAARGVIDHAIQARRATLLGERIVSISGQELLTVDATDRDRPRIVSELALVAPVDRVFVQGNQLVQLRNPTAASAQIALASVSSPELLTATLELDPLPIIGADLRGDLLYLLQFRADGMSNEVVFVEQQVVTSQPQPPIRGFRTNYLAFEVPPPSVLLPITHIVIRDESWSDEVTTNVTVQWKEVPQPIATNIVTTVYTRSEPPVPGRPGGGTYTLTWIRPEFISAPSTWKTNELVTSFDIPQPPLLVTNIVIKSADQWVRVPGELRFSVVEVGENALSLRGQFVSENPADFYGSSMKALWPEDGTLVWTESPGGTWWGGGVIDWFGPTLGLPLVQLRVWGGGPGWWGWGNETRSFFAFDVTDESAPTLAARERLSAPDWNSFSDAFAAEGKVFVSHRVSNYLPSSDPGDPGAGTANIEVGGRGGTIIFIGEPGTWEHEYFLDVLDFTDPAEPIIRAPAPLPGALKGISHAGQLLYATGPEQTTGDAPTDRESLHALAYDGVQASLVDSLPLPEARPRPLLVRPDGAVLLGRNPATTNDAPALETWAISVAGEFERYGIQPLRAVAEEARAFDDLLMVTSAGEFQFFDATDAATLAFLGVGERPCSVWFDGNNADATADTGLWLSRGSYGVWRVAIIPPE